MEIKRKNSGGRPHTDRVNRMNIALSDEAIALLTGRKNKSAFIDALIRGEVTQIKCPHCGKVFTSNFIDSLQEEPVSRTSTDIEAAMQEVDEKSKAFTEAHQGEDADTILAQMRGEDPVSEDLEEEIRKYQKEVYDRDTTVRDVARHFADWQKQQMMKDVIEATIIKTRVTNQTTAPTLSSVILSDAFHEGDKVKVKIFKEA